MDGFVTKYAVELDLERPLVHPGRDFGGQIELVRLAESARIDWRGRARAARSAIDRNALRLGSIRAK